MTLTEFKASIKKVSSSRNHEFKNSYGIKDAFPFYKKKYSSIKNIDQHLYTCILKDFHEKVKEYIFRNKEFQLPYNFGTIQILKYSSNIYYNKGTNKVKHNYRIDWNKTLALWYRNKNAHMQKQLIYFEEPETYKIFYITKHAKYNNKKFYTFKPSRLFKKQLKERLFNNDFETYLKD